MRTLIVLLVTLLAFTAPVRAQQATQPLAPAQGPLAPVQGTAPTPQTTPATTPGPMALDYSVIDRATVRVFAVHGVGTAAIPTSTGARRLLALPESSHGSGLLVSADGLIVTARHVVRDGTLLAVWVPGYDQAFEAVVVHEDDQWDLAVLAIQGTFRDFVPIAPLNRALRIREQVNAIGYPLDASRTDPQSAQGIVSGVLPTGELQLDIGVNPGNSGGPLIDASEQVVGIVVARGDVEQGVQSIGVAVPVEPIARVLATLTVGSGPVATARLELNDEGHGREVAELVQIIVRVRGTELFRDVERALEGRGTGEVLDRLRRFADHADDAETMALLAAYFWDAAALVLERAGGALRPSQLEAGPDRNLANDLLGRSVRLCFEARRRDATITGRSPFVAWVTYYLRDPSEVPFVGPSTPAPAPAAPSQAASRPQREAPVTPARVLTSQEQVAARDHRLRFETGLLLAIAGRNQNLSGAMTFLALSGSPYTLRFGIVALDLWLGATAGFQQIDSTGLYVGLDLGVSARFAETSGLVLAVAWSPAAVFHFNGTGVGGALGSWRTRVGTQIDSFQFGIEWHGLQESNAYVAHGIGLYLSWGFFH
jgi:S1-C subfamily serine protease